jgi:hypothetical protein
MRKPILFLALLLLPVGAFAAQTLAGAEANIDSQIDTAGPIINATITTCLASHDGCNTGWSCSLANYCNNTDAGTLCQITQDDPGILVSALNADYTCSVVSSGHTFASIGATLTPTAAACYHSTTYRGPGGAGVQLCYAFKYATVYYEKCRGYGPQASAFNVAWHTVTTP